MEVDRKNRGDIMKKLWMFLLSGCLFMFPVLAHAQLNKVVEGLLGREDSIRSEDLRVLQLEVTPDPVREGQRLVFTATISNGSRYSGRVTIAVKDRDQLISEVSDVVLRPGDNRITFPEIGYRFSSADHCFTVEADIERTRSLSMRKGSSVRKDQVQDGR